MKRFLVLLIILAACKSNNAPPKVCIAYSPDLMQHFTDGLKRKDFRLVNAWVVRSDKAMDTVPAYFLSADIVAPNGEAVIGTWLTDNIATGGRIYSVSPQAIKYSNFGGVGDKATSGVTVETGGAKESRACVLTHRANAAAPSATPQ
ncbi:MAG: hypothetical protein ABR585_13850 [Gemmatimonadaceae bacterium]